MHINHEQDKIKALTNLKHNIKMICRTTNLCINLTSRKTRSSAQLPIRVPPLETSSPRNLLYASSVAFILTLLVSV